jgi:L-2-hydroxyglutarate oxidase LhgO
MLDHRPLTIDRPSSTVHRQVYDIAIIGAGAVGSAIARELSRYNLKIALIESNPDVGMGTSKASTAIWHTGYDAKPNSLESKLLKRSYQLMDKYLIEANIAHERIGGLLIAWNQEQFETLPTLLEQAHENGDTDVRLISAQEIYEREPNINQGALGGLYVPGEGILCTFSVPLAFAYQAVENGVELFLNFEVEKVRPQTVDGRRHTAVSGQRSENLYVIESKEKTITTKYIVNAAGLFADEINAQVGKTSFKVMPRRGQLIIFDKLARPLVNHVLLPVPTSKTKGVLISPTVYGNILLGPTAEDLDDKTAIETTQNGLNFILDKAREILPSLLDEEITATYSGLRAATEFSDYQIEMDAEKRFLTLGGIRSTGISGAMGIAEYGVELLRDAGLVLKLKDDFKTIKMPTIGQASIRPHQDEKMIQENSSYAEMVCHCERVSRGELIDAMNAVIPATTLDGLRRRTRASQGRCQGFNCHAKLNVILSEAKNLSQNNHETLRSQQTLSQSDKKEVDVLIVGAGPAGLSAAIELKKQGIKNILVVDRESEAGGIPRLCHHTGFGREDLWRFWSGPRYANYYRDLAEKNDVEVLTSTTILGWNKLLATERTEENEKRGLRELSLSYTSQNGLGEIHAKSVLLATGVRERPRSARLIPGTRPQGIYTTGSLQRFVYEEKLPIGKKAVIVGAELVSLSVLLTLIHAKVECVGMVTEESQHTIEFPYIGMKWLLADLMTRTPIITNAKVTNIFGKKRVEAIEITKRPRRSLETSEVLIVECDSVIFTGNWIPEHELARNGGLEIDKITNGPVIDKDFHSSVKGVFVAGNLLRGVETADRCALEGKWTARAIAKFISITT